MYNDIELNIAMPYEEQSTNWVEEHRDRFFNVHAESDNVEIISLQYTDDCYELADEHSEYIAILVSHYGQLLVWDQSWLYYLHLHRD